MSTTAIVKKIYPMIEKALSDKKILDKYKRNIGSFMNARHEDLYDIAPFSRMYWGDNDTKAFYEALGITEVQVLAELRNTYYYGIASFNPRCAKDPFTVAQLMCVRYFYLKKMDKELELSVIYLSFSGSFYPSIHYGSFPKVQPSEYRHVMEHVVNNVLSNKFDLKREGSLIGAIRSINNTWIDSYGDRLKSCDDEDVVYILQQLHNRIKSFMINIAKEYYKAYENKDEYISYASDNASEDDFRVADNDSLKAERCVMNAMNYISTHGTNYKFCKMAADSNVRTDEIKSIIDTIQSDRNNLALIREMIGLLIIEYFKESDTKEVTGVDFLTFAISPKPNSKNPNYLRMKEIIATLLSENSPGYRKRCNRLPTANSYNRAILAYYSLVINYSNK